MKNFKQGTAIAILALALPFAAASSASAMPAASSLTNHSAAGTGDLTQVRWRSVPVIGGGGRGWHGGGWHGGYHRRGWGGAGVGLGVASGLLLGGALAAGASPYYYGPGYYYEPAPAPVYDDSVTYCMNRFKSYDPASGTYLGYDGLRHPCP